MNNSISVLIPAYNEESAIQSTIAKIEKNPGNYEIIVIDDGSTDKTFELIRDSGVIALRHTKNRGYGAALKTGFSSSKYNLVVFNDGDGQFDFSEIDRFLEKIEKADLVIGYRRKRHDNPFRHVLMNLLKIWDFVFFGFRFKDIDCGFKMFKKEALEKFKKIKPRSIGQASRISGVTPGDIAVLMIYLTGAKCEKIGARELETGEHIRD